MVIPSSTTRQIVKYYHTQLVTSTQTRNGRIVGQYCETKIDSSPFAVFEEQRLGRSYEMASISEIRVLRSTYSWNHIAYRMRKLGYVINRNDFQMIFDGNWEVYRPIHACRQVGSVSFYKPKAFERPASSGREVATASSDTAIKPLGSSEVHQPGEEVYQSSDNSHSDSEIRSNSGTHYDETSFIKVTPTETMHSDSPTMPVSPQVTIGEPSQSGRKGDVVYATEYYSTGTYRHNQIYHVYDPVSHTWSSSEQRPEGYSQIMPVTDADLYRIGKELQGRYDQEQANSSSSRDDSFPANFGSSSGGMTFSNSGSSTITWSSGQTSQTVTTSSGVHTIYR